VTECKVHVDNMPLNKIITTRCQLSTVIVSFLQYLVNNCQGFYIVVRISLNGTDGSHKINIHNHKIVCEYASYCHYMVNTAFIKIFMICLAPNVLFSKTV